MPPQARSSQRAPDCFSSRMARGQQRIAEHDREIEQREGEPRLSGPVLGVLRQFELLGLPVRGPFNRDRARRAERAADRGVPRRPRGQTRGAPANACGTQ